MKPEEAIKTLEVAKAECEWNAPLDYQGAFDVAISALEKQIPKKLTDISEDFGKCPTCGADILYNTEGYCAWCGQRYLWSEEG